MAKKILKIHPKDNAIVALRDLRKGETVQWEGQSFTLMDDIPAKHKFVTEDRAQGEDIFMYGILVGKARKSIQANGLLSTANIQHATAEFSAQKYRYSWNAPDVSKWKDKHFMGYHRSDGQVGVANYWIVVPLVFCENRNVRTMREAFVKNLGYQDTDPYETQVKELITMAKAGKSPSEILHSAPTLLENSSSTSQLFPNISGIKFLEHSLGCGGTSEDYRSLCGLLAGYINHPNVAGATVLSLGCQGAQIPVLKDELRKRNADFDKPLLIYEQQQLGTETHMLDKAIRETFVGMMQANKQERQPAHVSKLRLGMECGGSDGFSGISANPALGYTADLLVSLGGAVVLAEFPELCGVEQELINRCENEEIAQRFVDLQRAYAQRVEAVGSSFAFNPSPGNIKDGLITDAIKSAGAAKKGGTSPVRDVLDYPEPIQKQGLNLLCTPGGDVESTTAMAGSGCTLMLFTTGLGTPTGNAVTPVIKVSTNTSLAERMPDIIDINAGEIVTGEKSIEEVGAEILDLCIQVASGAYTPHAVRLNQDDFIPWKRGVSL